MLANNRIWMLAGSITIVAVLALAGLLGVKPQFDAAKASDDERASTEIINAQHRNTLAALKTEFSRLPEVTAEVAELRKSISSTIDLDPVIAELVALQASSGVTITSYTSTDPIPFLATEAVSAQVPPTVDGSNLLTTELRLSVSGAPDAAMSFVRALQTGSRLYFVSDLTIGPNGTNTMTVIVYTLLDEPLVDPAATEALPAEPTAAE